MLDRYEVLTGTHAGVGKNLRKPITCTCCKKLYIGETGRRLGVRFREYLSWPRTHPNPRKAAKLWNKNSFFNCKPALLTHNPQLRRRPNTRNVSLWISSRWPIHIVNPVEKKYLVILPTDAAPYIVFSETYPPSFICASWQRLFRVRRLAICCVNFDHMKIKLIWTRADALLSATDASSEVICFVISSCGNICDRVILHGQQAESNSSNSTMSVNLINTESIWKACFKGLYFTCSLLFYIQLLFSND